MANVLALALVLIAVTAVMMMAEAQSQPPPSSSCGASLATLAPCLASLQAGLNATSPTQGCCTAFVSVVDSNAVCICELFTTTNNPLGIPINQTQALTLPGACKITTPSLTQCMSAAGAGAPVSTPVSTPLPAASSPSPAATIAAKSPAKSVYPFALPPAISGGALSPSGSHEGPPAFANAGWMMSLSMSNMLIAGLIDIIAAIIIV